MPWWGVLVGILVLAIIVNGVFDDSEKPAIIVDSPAAERAETQESEAVIETNPATERSFLESKLDLSNRNLTEVPIYTFTRRHLTYLDLSNNNLTGALQAEVRRLEKLQILDLSDNNFTGVPAEVGQLSQLRVLDLSNNQLTGLPHEIANLANLEILDLRGNNPSSYDLSIIRAGIPNAEILVD